MTLAPPQGVTDRAGVGPVPTPAAHVTVVLVLHGPTSALPQTLDSLARQTRSPERLVVVDPGLDGEAVETVRAHEGVAAAIPSMRFVTVPGSAPLAYAVKSALEHEPNYAAPEGISHSDGQPVEHVWVLTCDSAAAPMTLARLLDAVRRSPSAGIAGPKLLDWHRPGALRSVGLQLTRSGRVVPSPVPGEPDQGQYDRRSDVLAVPLVGMLVERALFEGLAGPDTLLGDFGSELDFSWRAQLTGRRVVVVPRATLRTGAAPSQGSTGAGTPPRVRRQARRVALARCALWAMPLMAVWIAVSSVLAASALLVAKQPRVAWSEISDVGAVLAPGRALGARWRSRGRRTVRRRDLRGLFVRPSTALRHASDLIHDQVALDTGDLGESDVLDEGVESGPVSDEAQDLNTLGATWASRALRNPGLYAVAASMVVAAVASRRLGGGMLDRLEQGLAGGELIGMRASAGTLWHAWLDGWHGAGLGQAGDQGPHLAVLAALAWLVSHVPLVGPSLASPVGAVLALLVGLAMPLATLTAYLGARVITHSPWPRALAALAWSFTSVMTTAVASGRLGALVAAILLPLVAAGVALSARREGSATTTAATVLAAAVVGAFVPALLVLVVVAGLLVLTLGRREARVRGLLLAVGPVVLIGPWAATLVEHPVLLLTGPGLSVWGTGQARPWQLALLHPGGPGSYPVLLSAPLVLAGALAVLRRGRAGQAASALAILALVGLAYALAAPHVVVGTVPVGVAHAGAPITVWSGVGLLLASLGLVAAALLGTRGLPVRQARGGAMALARWPVAAAVMGGVLAAGIWTSVHTVGSTLHTWQDPRPAVAVDQAESPLANRMLLLEPEAGGLAYRLLGREVGDVARSLPTTTASADSGAVAAAVSELFEQGAAPGALHPAQHLSDQAVGFVGLRTDPTDPRIRALDATAGLSRLGEHDGIIFWRVLAGGGMADDGLAPARAQVVSKAGQTALAVAGDHGRLSARAAIPRGAALVLAEPPEWVHHARVSVDGTVLAPVPGRAAYALPAGRATVTVDVLPTDQLWRYAQGLALALALFIAIPLGGRGRRRPA